MCEYERRHLSEVNQDIEYVKAKLNMAKTEEEFEVYNAHLVELREEKRDIWKHLFD